jgi:23S rRNA U2552 (ribose-2'-O)-methylase RlmE/FtsJ
MENVNTKPPWTKIQWFSTAPKVTVADLSGCPIVGEWVEDTNEEIEHLKESIQPYDRTELWDLAKRITNPYELINTYSSRLALPKSTCMIHPLSRSFFKMIEILQQLNFFDRHKTPKFKSLHICEGPGGFIEAFHYMADAKKRTIGSSHAMTLKSTHTMIPGWRRATQFLQKHPNVSLLYGPTRTGDIYEPANQAACKEAVNPGAHLVTADGGFDFSDDFHAQEKNILRLLVSSAIILLDSVAYEGDVVLKLFDCNAPATRDLIALMASCFQNWTLYKPVTSRPCNSEWYFLGKGAHRDRKVVLAHLSEVRDGLAQTPPVNYIRLVHSNPLEEKLLELQHQRCSLQMTALKEVLSFCKNKDTLDHMALWETQREPTILWCNLFHIPSQFRSRI